MCVRVCVYLCVRLWVYMSVCVYVCVVVKHYAFPEQNSKKCIEIEYIITLFSQ